MSPVTAPRKQVIKARANILALGDALTCVPWLLALRRWREAEVYVEGPYNSSARMLVGDLPLIFERPSGVEVEDHGDVVRIQDAFELCHAGSPDLHIAQAHFVLAGMAPPALPLRLPLRRAPSGLAPSAVIAPFSLHDRGRRRQWSERAWREVIAHLLEVRRFGVVYLIGSADDDPTPFACAGVVPILGRPLPQVADLLATAPMFISIDSGPSHMAQFLGQTRHLLICSDTFGERWACNPHGRQVRAPLAELSAGQVISVVEEMLDR